MKALRLVLVLVLVFSFVACTSKQQRDLTGSWQKEDGTGTMEFTKDGKLNLAGGPAAISAGYKLKDKDQLQVDLGMFGTGTLKYVLDNDTLTITDAAGNASKYTRAKAVKEAKAKEVKPQAEVKGTEQKPQPEAQAKEQKPQAEAPKHK